MAIISAIVLARDDRTGSDPLRIDVTAQQFAWTFKYPQHNNLTTNVLRLPIGRPAKFDLRALDVIHSFWVPQFLQKLDMIPGKVNRFEVVPTETGTFQGKCAELCGAYHSQMLFQVKVVSQQDFQAHMAQLRAAGNIGALDNSLSREPIEKQQQQFVPSAEAATGSSN